MINYIYHLLLKKKVKFDRSIHFSSARCRSTETHSRMEHINSETNSKTIWFLKNTTMWSRPQLFPFIIYFSSSHYPFDTKMKTFTSLNKFICEFITQEKPLNHSGCVYLYIREYTWWRISIRRQKRWRSDDYERNDDGFWKENPPQGRLWRQNNQRLSFFLEMMLREFIRQILWSFIGT